MLLISGVVLGVVIAVVLRWLLARGLLIKLRRDVAALNRGDHRPLLQGYAQHAVLEFNDNVPRWAGEGGRHVGRPGIEAFLLEFVRCGIQGEIRSAVIHGWPWALKVMVRFDDHARDDDGQLVYTNRTVLACQTKWGKIVRQEDYYYDTVRIAAFDDYLRKREAE